MKFSWFYHNECSSEQADELTARYRSRGVQVDRSLNRDLITWTVSARLPEYPWPPRQDRTFQQRIWG